MKYIAIANWMVYLIADIMVVVFFRPIHMTPSRTSTLPIILVLGAGCSRATNPPMYLSLLMVSLYIYTLQEDNNVDTIMTEAQQ
jgi:hypothetical protein